MAPLVTLYYLATWNLITINQKEHPEVFLDEIFMYCALNWLIGVAPDYY